MEVVIWTAVWSTEDSVTYDLKMSALIQGTRHMLVPDGIKGRKG